MDKHVNSGESIGCNNDDNSPQGEGKNMSTVLDEKRIDVNEKLKRIAAKAPSLKTKNGIIVLDPNNPLHRKWYEDDEDYEYHNA